MPSASAPFKAKAPFHSRIIGLDYQAFGLDFINPPFPSVFGCLSVTPLGDFNSSGPTGGPFTPPTNVYTISNVGGTTMSWSVSASQTWLSPDTLSGTLAPGESQDVTVTLAADSLADNPVPYTGTITFTNTTNNCGDTTVGVSLSVTGATALVVQYRTKGGTANVCGYSEYTTPSTPPKKYRLLTLSGAQDFQHFPFGVTDCSGAPDCRVNFAYSGTCTYDSSTCVVANSGGQYVISRSIGACIGIAPDGTYPTCSIGSASVLLGDVEVLTKTTRQITCPGFPCYDSGLESASRTVSDKKETLSVEDTDSDAITRLMAASSYTGYSTAVAIGDAKSQYQQRTTTFNFTYQYAQYLLTKSGLTPSTLYNGSATIFRRLWGSSDPWVFVSTVLVSGTTSGGGVFTFGPFDLPIAAGYEYTIWNAAIS